MDTFFTRIIFAISFANAGPSPNTTISISFDGLPIIKSRTYPPIINAGIPLSVAYLATTLNTGCFN